MLTNHFSISAALAISIALVCMATAHEVKPLSKEQAADYKLAPAFFKKVTMAEGILIATSAKVTDYTHLEAAYLFGKVMSDLRPDIAQRIRDQKVLCVLLAHDELTSDVPIFKSDLKGKELDFYNWRQRGFLTKEDDRYIVLFAEEDVMEYEGGMQLESILIHEFGHVIHGAGFDDELKKRWAETFENAKAKGIYNDGYAAQRFRRVLGDEPVLLLDVLVKAFPAQSPDLLRKCLDGGDILVNGEPTTSAVKITGEDKVLIVFGGKKDCYASKNKGEYFAEGVQDWYDTNRTMDHDHNHIHTRAQLKEYDPMLADLLTEILGDHEWRFSNPRERAGKDHLKGYDPAKSPVVKPLEHIRIAGLDYYDEYWSAYWKRLGEKYPAEQ